jgi:hypothetical protein
VPCGQAVRNVFQKLSRTEQRREGVVAYLCYSVSISMVKTGFCRNRSMQTGSSGTYWLEIWSNHLSPSIGPNGGSVTKDSGMSDCLASEQFGT